MKIKSNKDSPPRGVRAKPLKPLNKVLVQTEEVKGLVDEAVQELSSVNARLKQALDENSPPPHVEAALEKSESVEGKVQKAAEKLAVVNGELKDAVHKRQALEIQLDNVVTRL